MTQSPNWTVAPPFPRLIIKSAEGPFQGPSANLPGIPGLKKEVLKMAENNVTRTLVRAAVARALREIEEDQRRAMRRITDMGRQFSRSRFQILVFDIIQEFLSDDDSIYYAMTENLLQATDHDSLADFGVNLAYMSWTHGARILRRSQKALGVCLPWEISLCYDPGREDSLTQDEIRRIIDQGRELGIYTWHINQRSAKGPGSALPDLMAEYPDCAFFWGLSRNDLTADQASALKNCRNAMVLLNGKARGLTDCAALLRREKLLFGVWASYKAKEDLDGLKEDLISSLARDTLAPYLVLVPEEGADPSVMEEASLFCRRARMDQAASCLLVDYAGDSRMISDLICGHRQFLAVGPDRRILYPGSTGERIFDREADLSALFKDIFPPCPEDFPAEDLPASV